MHARQEMFCSQVRSYRARLSDRYGASLCIIREAESETGSAYSEYLKSGTMHGETLQPGLPESYKFPQPLFTPSTKADVGDKDENINIAQCAL